MRKKKEPCFNEANVTKQLRAFSVFCPTLAGEQVTKVVMKLAQRLTTSHDFAFVQRGREVSEKGAYGDQYCSECTFNCSKQIGCRRIALPSASIAA